MIFQSFAASSAKPSLRKKCAKKFEQKFFDIFDDFSKWSEKKMLQNFEKSSNKEKI